MRSYKEHFRRFLEADPGRLHFAAHSHHLWPDVTRDAVLECWDDAARSVDKKWDRILGEVVPQAQRHIARTLDLSRPEQIAFAPNTHEFVVRLLSCLLDRSPLRILTTDSEFMSFARQSARLEEVPQVKVTRIPTEPFDTFEERFKTAAVGDWDLVYLSQVFYNSAFAIADLPAFVSAVRNRDALVVIDGYHGFMAIPTSLRQIEDRVFYLAGGYKYAMSGEGACFLHVPAGCPLRPVDTGWFATFGRLTQAPAKSGVEYSEDGYRFWGATFDPTSLYRFNSVMDWLNRLGVGVPEIRAHVLSLQERFLAGLERDRPVGLSRGSLLTPVDDRRGNFLTFRLPEAESLAHRLGEGGVVVDHRGDRLRFGFGLYHDPDDVDGVVRRLSKL